MLAYTKLFLAISCLVLLIPEVAICKGVQRKVKPKKNEGKTHLKEYECNPLSDFKKRVQ